MRSLLALFGTLGATVLFADQPQLALQSFASGLNRPVGIVSAGDSRLFIVLQTGQIVIHDGARVLPTPFLDIRSLISPGISGESERGLLGLAFHPRFAENGFFFVHYTAVNGDVTIARYSASFSSPDRAEGEQRHDRPAHFPLTIPQSQRRAVAIRDRRLPLHRRGRRRLGR